MIKIIMGEKGHGKTKMLIELTNQAVNSEMGNVICIKKNKKLTYDVSHKARLVSTSDYNVKGFNNFLAFIKGMISVNFDISHILIDSIYKITDCDDNEMFENFLEEILDISQKHNIKFTIAASTNPDNVTDNIRRYVINT